MTIPKQNKRLHELVCKQEERRTVNEERKEVRRERYRCPRCSGSFGHLRQLEDHFIAHELADRQSRYMPRYRPF